MKVLLSLWLSLLMGHGLVVAQDKLRLIQDAQAFPRQPIDILNKSVGDRRVNSDGFVLASRDWINDFTIEFRNNSTKNITRVYIHLEVQPAAAMQLPLIIPVIYRASEDKNVGLNGKRALAPGAIAFVKAIFYQKAIDILKKYGVDEVSNTRLSIRTVDFDDDTQWNVGFENKRDPDNPEKWIRTIDRVQSTVFF